MISIPSPLQSAVFLLIFGIIICLIFETTGVPEGFRRHGNRNYLSLISALVVLVVFILVAQADSSAQVAKAGLIFDRVSQSSILALSVLVLAVIWIIVERLKPLNGDRGEIYALLLLCYFFAIIMSCANDLTIMASTIVAVPCGQMGIIALRKKRHSGSEVALKLTLYLAFLIAMLGLILILSDSSDPSLTSAPSRLSALVLLMSIVFLTMGIVPLQTIQVAILEGSPSYVSSFFSASTLITSSAILIRLSNTLSLSKDSSESAYWIFIFFAAASMCLGPIMAFDQRKIARLLAYLLVSQAGLVLIFASLTLRRAQIPNYLYGLLFTHFALCAAGIYAGLNYWKDAKHSFRSWEDFAGAGRKHPLAAGAFFVVIASVIGLPFTSGFLVRHTLINATDPSSRAYIICIVLVSVVLGAVAVMRLFAFFFGKATRHDYRKHHKPTQTILLLFCAAALVILSMAPKSVLVSLFAN